MNLRFDWMLAAATLALLVGCSSDDTNNSVNGAAGAAGMAGATGDDLAIVQIQNDFNNPTMSYKPPWTICESSYLGTEFGKIELGTTSVERSVHAGLGYVLMVAAWNDPTCNPENALPIASKNEEEVVVGQSRTIVLNMPNHQGPCPPEGVAPIPEELYDAILAKWPSYGFKPYAERTSNSECTE